MRPAVSLEEEEGGGGWRRGRWRRRRRGRWRSEQIHEFVMDLSSCVNKVQLNKSIKTFFHPTLKQLMVTERHRQPITEHHHDESQHRLH